VKPIWLPAAFVAGIAVGILATRMFAEVPTDEAQASNLPASGREPPRGTQSSTPFERSATPARTAPAASSSADDVTSVKSAPARTAPVEAPAADSGAFAQPIDAGDVFNKMIAQPAQPGFENNIGEAHRALERETRDDGWAYTMEAEIQNAMVTEVSTGAFRSEHVECRATMCELRLSGKGEQAAAIKRWSDELGSQPFGQRLFLNYSSSISDNKRVDALMIFRRPPKASATTN
jgi:hypothetical protein